MAPNLSTLGQPGGTPDPRSANASARCSASSPASRAGPLLCVKTEATGRRHIRGPMGGTKGATIHVFWCMFWGIFIAVIEECLLTVK